MRSSRALHPILFAIFPTIFLYARNIEEVSPSAVVAPMAVSLAATLAIWAALRAWTKNRAKSAVLTSGIVMVFFSYGHVQSWLLISLCFRLFRNSLFLPIWLAMGAVGFWLVLRTKRDLEPISGVMNAVSLVLVGLSAIGIVRYAAVASRAASGGNTAQQAEARPAEGRNALPDVYYIVLDSYPDARTLKEIFRFDNSEFIGGLRKLGFFVATRSFANYPETITSVPSCLNMQYVHEGQYVRLRRSELLRMVRDNKVWQVLRARGYRQVLIDSISDKSSADFAWELLNTTILFPINILMEGHGLFYDADRQRNKVLSAFRELAAAPALRGPKFVYAHIYSPHEPALFGPHGERVALSVPEQKQRVGGIRKIRRLFVGQVRFVNYKALILAREIISKSEVPPIIIFQADHGPGIALELERAQGARHQRTAEDTERLLSAHRGTSASV